AKSSSHRKERRVLAVGQQHRGPRHPARRLGSGPRKSRQRFNFRLGHRQLNCVPPCCHDTNPRSANLKRGIHQHTSSSLGVPVSWNRSSSSPSSRKAAVASRCISVCIVLLHVEVEAAASRG